MPVKHTEFNVVHLQVAPAGEDEEDLRIVDRQKHTARGEDDHGDIWSERTLF